jgi:hypothetical protein
MFWGDCYCIVDKCGLPNTKGLGGGVQANMAMLQLASCLGPQPPYLLTFVDCGTHRPCLLCAPSPSMCDVIQCAPKL